MMPRRNHARHPRRKRGSYTTFLFPPVDLDSIPISPPAEPRDAHPYD